MKIQLKSGDVDVETQNLIRERVLAGQLLRPCDALLPGMEWHDLIIGAEFASRNHSNVTPIDAP